MFLLEPDETRFDLRWRMFGTPVRVHPMFWLMAVVLGWNVSMSLGRESGAGMAFLLVWIACVFVSILVHEMGHVVVGRLFGSPGHIVLYSFGGLAIGSSNLARRWQRISVSLAGPVAQLVLWGGVLAVSLVLPVRLAEPWGAYLEAAELFLLLINLWWAVLNLFPIWPLDGGQIARELCQGVLGARGVSVSLGISMVVAGLLAVHFLMSSRGRPLLPYVPRGGMLSALLFAMLCLSSFSALQAENDRRRRWDDDEWT